MLERVIQEHLSNGKCNILCCFCRREIVRNADSVRMFNYVPLIVKHSCKATVIECFDNIETKQFTQARMDFLFPIISELKNTIGCDSALDVGCGIGDFSHFISKMGIQCVGIDGRPENIQEAEIRFPSPQFITGDVETIIPLLNKRFDLVLCLGLLYHLENPFKTLRDICSATHHVLIVESMVAPGKRPALEILDEGVVRNQGLHYTGTYPSESGLIKMLYICGFPFVYRFSEPPLNKFYMPTLMKHKQRTILLAAKTKMSLPNIILAKNKKRWANAEFWNRWNRFKES